MHQVRLAKVLDQSLISLFKGLKLLLRSCVVQVTSPFVRSASLSSCSAAQISCTVFCFF